MFDKKIRRRRVCEEGACFGSIAALEHPEAAELRDQAAAWNDNIESFWMRGLAASILFLPSAEVGAATLVVRCSTPKAQSGVGAALCFRRLEDEPL